MGRNSAVKQIYLILFDLEREKRVTSFNEGVEVLQTGLHHRIRAKFEKLVTDFPQCAVGWRLYLAFEQKCGNQTNYESIFYRATEYLPYQKQLYIDACIYLPYRVDEFLRSLSDRDLRIRTPIEEIRMMLDAPEGVPEEPKAESEDDVVEGRVSIRSFSFKNRAFLE